MARLTKSAGQVVGEIERRLTELEFVDGAGRDIRGGVTYGLVADVNAVHIDAGGSAETAAE